MDSVEVTNTTLLVASGKIVKGYDDRYEKVSL